MRTVTALFALGIAFASMFGCSSSSSGTSCPTGAPLVGDSCSDEKLGCAYVVTSSCESFFVCTSGKWAQAAQDECGIDGGIVSTDGGTGSDAASASDSPLDSPSAIDSATPSDAASAADGDAN